MSVPRLTPLGIMILALLREDDMHPYEMLRLLRIRRDERLVTVTNGTLYHTVSRLEAQGLVEEVGVDREGRRPERTTYRLLPAGDAAVLDWVRYEIPRIDRPAEFAVALAEAHNLERDEAASLLRERRVALAASLTHMRASLAHARSRPVPEQFLVEPDRAVALAAADLAWLDELLDRLDRSDVPWGPDVGPHDDAYRAQREAARA